MFLRFFSFQKLPVTSSASRNVYYFKPRWALFFKIRYLSLHKTWKAGRNDSGHVVMRTRTSLLRRCRSFQINYHFRYIKLGFISQFQFIPFKNKLLSLIHFSNGSLSYFITTENHKLFSFFYLNKNKRFGNFFDNNLFRLLIQLKVTAKVSLLEISPGKGSQYCRSSGTFGKIIKFDRDNFSVLIKLPSGCRKIFSYYSFVAIGEVALNKHANFLNSKAGYWRGFGVKSTVRGVAMNPVDHPHGGRTKSIKYPRTPWGKTTKFK